MGGGWLTNSAGGRYDEVIEVELETLRSPAAVTSPATSPELSPEELQDQIDAVAQMLRSAADAAPSPPAPTPPTV